MSDNFRCNCPFTSALDILGDKWTLVIVKQMLFENKETFKDFLESEEAIATNILSSRLKMLESLGIITKGKVPDNKKTNIYRLTNKGLALAPVLVELAIWSDNHIRDLHTDLLIDPSLTRMQTDKQPFIESVVSSYKAKD